MPNDLLAELAQLDHISGVKQANNDNLALVDGLDLYAGNDDILGAHARHRRRRRHPRREPHRRVRRCGAWSTSPRAAPQIEAELQPLYAALGIGPAATTTKAALRLLGHDVGIPRLPLRRRRRGRARDAARGARRARPAGDRAEPLMAANPARPSARRTGRDRQEHDGPRVRGPSARRRLRPALPDRRDGRHRPRAARLLLPARARRRHRGHRHHARPRGPPRRAAVDPARARPRGRAAAGLRRAADDGDGALQARRAPPQGRRGRGRRDRREARARAVRRRARPHDALDPGRLSPSP